MIRKFIDGEPLNFNQAKIAAYVDIVVGALFQVPVLLLYLGFKDSARENQAAIAATLIWAVGFYSILRGFSWNSFTSPAFLWRSSKKTE